MKVDRFELKHGTEIEIACPGVLAFNDNVLALMEDNGVAVLYINVDTGLNKKTKFNILEVNTAEEIHHIGIKNYVGTVKIDLIVKHYFVVTNDEFLIYFNN